MSSQFASAVDIFLDFVDIEEYVQLNRTRLFYTKLKNTIQKPLKIILLYGRPGTGKSMLLSKLYNDLQNSSNIYLYATPITEQQQFFKHLYKDIFKTTPPSDLDLYLFQEKLQELDKENTPVVLLDEAQLYPADLIEKIRLLADSRMIKFVITLHKTDEEDIIAKEHFQTRIWESIELNNMDKDELKVYIQTKLMQHSNIALANMFDEKSLEKIYNFTQGNFRTTNKLLYTLFTIYSWYESHSEGKYRDALTKATIQKELIEMAALEVGLLDD